MKIKEKNCSALAVNNIEEIEYAYKKGINKKTPIYTYSPQILLNKKYPTAFTLENRLGIKGAEKIRKKLSNFEKEILPIIKKNKVLNKYKLAIFSAIQDSQNCFIKAYVLKNKDYKKKIAVIKNNEIKEVTKTTNFEWSEIIPKKKQILIKYNSNKNITIKRNGLRYNLHKINSFFKEFLLSPRNVFIKQLILKFNLLLIPFFNKGKILICYDNPLISDSLYYLLLKGYLPKYINLKNFFKNKKLKKKVKSQVKKELVPRLKVFLKKNLCKANKDIVLEAIIKRIYYWIQQFDAGYKWWDRKLDYYNSYSKLAILSNTYHWPHATCLQKICEKKKIKTFICQHGIAKEITNFTSSDSNDETSKGNILFSYNHKYCSMNNKNIFKTARLCPVGTPESYLKYPKIFFKNKMDFLFIGSNRYVGDVAGNLECSDAQSAKQDIFIIKTILSKLKQNFFYKPYPNLERYSDPDYVKEIISNYKNIFYLETKENARNFYSKSKILITTKASSSFTWCFMTNKPIILIDCPTQPFKNSIKDLLKKAVFFFDLSEKGSVTKLRTILSKKPEEIEKVYEKKLYYRKLLKNYLFSFNDSDTGKKIANIVHNNL